MRFFHRVRTLRHWPRALLVGLVLAFGLNAIAHAAHRHDPATPTNALHSIACGYCVSFGGHAAAPTHCLPALVEQIERCDAARAVAGPVTAWLHSPSQPRAPPTFLSTDLAGLR
jgi:hypothetical protein